MTELIPSHVQKVFARVYHESRTITPTQLVVAVESHAGHGEGAEVELSAAYSAVAKAVALDTRGKTLLERVEPILSNLEKFFAKQPQLRDSLSRLGRKISSLPIATCGELDG